MSDQRPNVEQLELEKLQREIEGFRLEQEKTALESRKLRIEAENLEQEAKKIGWGRFFRIISSQAAFITAILAVVVSALSAYLNWKKDLETRNLEEFHKIVAEFSSAASTSRAGSAVILGEIARIGEGHRRLQARSLLLAGLGAERDFSARSVIETALVSVGPEVVEELRVKRREVVRELRIAFARGAKPRCNSYSDDELSRLRVLQEGLLTLAKAIARIEKTALDLREAPFRCASFMDVDATGAQMQGAVFWQGDLSRAILRDADFSDAQLDDADFFEADISGAKFCGPKLTGLTDKIRAARGWESAYYQSDFVKRMKAQTGTAPRSCS